MFETDFYIYNFPVVNGTPNTTNRGVPAHEETVEPVGRRHLPRLGATHR